MTKFVGINGHFYSEEFLFSVWKTLEKKIPLWLTGLETPNPVERFAYDVLKDMSWRIKNIENL